MAWLAALLLQADSEAELLRIVEKFRAAQTISAKCSTTVVMDGFGARMTSVYEGEIRLAKGNKARVSVDIHGDGGSRWTYLMVSDGEKMWGEGGDRSRRDTWKKAASTTLYPLLSYSLLTGGAQSVQPNFWLALDPECDMQGVGGEFKNDGREFRALERKGEEQAVVFASGKPQRRYESKLWYEPKTLTPLRREGVQVETFDPQTKSVTTWRDVYQDFKLDAPLAPELFKIPD